jgi:pectate lyase
MGVKDLFTECAKDDDKAIREQLKAGVADASADLSAFSDRALDEGYGIGEADGGTSSAASGGASTDKATARNAANIVQQVSSKDSV